MNERYAGEDAAPPKIFYHPDFAAENAVHRRYRNHTGSAGEETSPFRRLYCRSGIAPCPEDHLLVSF